MPLSIDARQQSSTVVTTVETHIVSERPILCLHRNVYGISTAHHVLCCQTYCPATGHAVCVTGVISTCTCFGEAGGVSGSGWQLVSIVAGSFPPVAVFDTVLEPSTTALLLTTPRRSVGRWNVLQRLSRKTGIRRT